MNERIKKLWVDALRGGDYTQAKGQLMRLDCDTGEKSYCCLGVLCNLHQEEAIGWPGGWSEETYLNQTAELPMDVIEWSEVNGIDPDVEMANGDMETLSNLNDGGTTFEDIAAYIERQL
jgi:hypothetical protein